MVSCEINKINKLEQKKRKQTNELSFLPDNWLGKNQERERCDDDDRYREEMPRRGVYGVCVLYMVLFELWSLGC